MVSEPEGSSTSIEEAAPTLPAPAALSIAAAVASF